MSDPVVPPVPAGWYPDPENPTQGRYWDGAAWTQNFHTPGQAPAALRAPAGTQPYTPWIWAFVLLPVVTLIPLLFISWDSMFMQIDPRDPDSALNAQFAFLTSPAYVASILLSIATYAASVVLAYLDHRELTVRQVPKPFHWAWAFIPSYGLYVYGIGRSVVVRSRLGGGALGPIWAMIAVFVVGLVISFVMVAQMMAAMSGFMTTLR